MNGPARQRAWHAVPFALTAFLPLLLAPLPGPGWDAVELALGIGGAMLVAALLVAVPWSRLPSWVQYGPLVLALVSVAVLRDAAGGNSSGLGPLVLLPALWTALYGTRPQLAAAVAGAALVYWAPIEIAGGGAASAYPESGWRVGAVFVVVAALAGIMIQHLRATVREQARQLSLLAHSDELTGLPNRRAWDDHLKQALARAHRSGHPLCVGLLDVDGFKAVNDHHGHLGGDRLLVDLCSRWTDELREGDVIARLGGDEFAVLLEDCSEDGALVVLERIRAACRGTTVSIGLAAVDPDERTDHLMHRADEALYAAKRAGRDQVVASPHAALAQ